MKQSTTPRSTVSAKTSSASDITTDKYNKTSDDDVRSDQSGSSLGSQKSIDDLDDHVQDNDDQQRKEGNFGELVNSDLELLDEYEFEGEGENEVEIGLEAEQDDTELLAEKKKIYRYARHKQDKLIAIYMQCIQKLKIIRKRNLYFQDRIYKYLQEKEKVLKECHEAVKSREEKARQQRFDEMERSSKQLLEESVSCDSNKDKEDKKNKKKKKAEVKVLAKVDAKRKRKSEKTAKKHLKSLKEKQLRKRLRKFRKFPVRYPNKTYGALKATQTVMYMLKTQKSKDKLSRKTPHPRHLKISLQSSGFHKQSENEKMLAHMEDGDEELRVKQENNARKSRIPLKHASKVPNHSVDHDDSENLVGERGSRGSERRSKAFTKRKSVWDELENIFETRIKLDVESEDDFEGHEGFSRKQRLPVFAFELAGTELTKMSYGDKLFKEMQELVAASKFPVKLKWPLEVRGFIDYFKKSNIYGKVIYTLRTSNQIRSARKDLKKLKFALHNLNYQMQQHNVLRRVHAGNIQYLQNNKLKWESLADDLFVTTIEELQDYSQASAFVTGKRIPADVIFKNLYEVTKAYDDFQHAVKLLYKVILNVGIVLRHLVHSESHGEGVELYEFKHLLRTNETIGAQHEHKRQMLRNFKRKCSKFLHTYRNVLDVKLIREKEVSEKSQVSTEMSSSLQPKQDIIKDIELLAVDTKRQESELRLEAGIIPYKFLSRDYEKSFGSISDARSRRATMQGKFNYRVRDIHRMYDDMEEIQRMLPFVLPPEEHLPLIGPGVCISKQFVPSPKHPVLPPNIRPSTAPLSLSTRSKGSTASIRSYMSRDSRPSVFFTKDQTRNMLEQHVKDSTRPRTSIASQRLLDGLSTLDKYEESLKFKHPLKSKYEVNSQRPHTANSMIPKYNFEERKRSIFLNNFSEYADEASPGIKQGLVSKIINQEDEAIVSAHKKMVKLMKPTAAKTGIVPIVTMSKMITDTRIDIQKKDVWNTSKKMSKKLVQRPKTVASLVPVVPENSWKYEMEEKRWPYAYFDRRPPSLKATLGTVTGGTANSRHSNKKSIETSSKRVGQLGPMSKPLPSASAMKL